MTERIPAILEYPDPVLGTIEIPIGELETRELNSEHVKEERVAE